MESVRGEAKGGQAALKFLLDKDVHS